jgi:hypothetical protein
MRVIQYKEFFVRPRPMLSDVSTRPQNLHCEYHNDCGHLTKDCISLRKHLENLVNQGHLQKYVKDVKGKKQGGNQKLPNPEVGERAGSGDTINTIYRVIDRKQAS